MELLCLLFICTFCYMSSNFYLLLHEYEYIMLWSTACDCILTYVITDSRTLKFHQNLVIWFGVGDTYETTFYFAKYVYLR